MTTITVEQYVELRRKELDQFEAYWLAMHRLEPDDWPAQMTEGEWFEQEAGFCPGGEHHD